MWPVKVHEYSRNTEEEIALKIAVIPRLKYRGEKYLN